MLWTVACQSSLSIGFSRLEYEGQNKRVFVPPSNDLPHPRIKPTSPISSSVQADSLSLSISNSLPSEFSQPIVFFSLLLWISKHIPYLFFYNFLFSEFKFLKSKLITFLLPCGVYHSVFHRVFAGREQINQNGVSRLSCPTLANNDYVTTEIIYSTAHAHQEVLTWSRTTLGCRDISAHLESGGIYCCITVGSSMRVENIACLVLQLLHQPGVNNVMATVPARRE